MAPISRICQYLTSSIRSKYVHKRLNNPVKTGSSPWRGLALRWWTGGAIGTGAAYFLGKKICPTGPFTHAIQNIYSTFFGSSTVKTPSIPNEISRKVVSPSGIEKINNDLYISRRAEDTDLTFVLSRLTDDNLDVWWRLHGRWGTRRGSEVLRKLCDDDQCKGWTDKQMEFFTAGIEAGAMAFRHTLQMYEASQTDAIRPEIWISYALSGKNIDPAKPIHESLFPRVEMAMTALTHPDVPVVVHMGIGRTTYNTKSICNGVLPQHKELSIPLHGFTAKAILETPQGHDKIWMYTSPALTMAKILNKALPKDIFLNEKKDRMPIIREKDGSLSVKNRAGQIVSTFTREESVSGKTKFLQHPEMYQILLDRYAVDYRGLANLFDSKKIPEDK